jgi:outer membrane protein OmpA-like peptidoglycan-associated protein
MKKLALLCVLLALVAAGCGKKREKVQPRSKVPAKSRSIKKNKNLALKDTEDFFDNDAVSDFAFVDDENEKKAKTDAKKDLALAQNDINEAAQEDLTADQSEESGIAFKTVHFDLNRNKIRPDQKTLVEEDCNLAKEATQKGKHVVVHGHCCQLGSHSYNMALSQQRAETIKQEMIRNGIDEKDIKTVGYGSEMPLVWSEKKDRASLIKELAPNRRAEIMVN